MLFRESKPNILLVGLLHKDFLEDTVLFSTFINSEAPKRPCSRVERSTSRTLSVTLHYPHLPPIERARVATKHKGEVEPVLLRELPERILVLTVYHFTIYVDGVTLVQNS